MIYFDWNATAPLHPVVQGKILGILKHPHPANASSLHTYGRAARHVIDETKECVLDQLNDTDKQYKIIFTASGTEANNHLLYSFKDREIFISNVEHASIIQNKHSNSILIPCDNNGCVTPKQVMATIEQNSPSPGFLVSVMHANNETGVINDIAKIADIVHRQSGFMHSDLSQSVGKIPVDLKILEIDYATISGHKMGAMNGAAMLLYRNDVPLIPLLLGGKQEMGLRAGTENVIAIQSIRYAFEELPHILTYSHKIAALRDTIEQNINTVHGSVLISNAINRLPNTTMITMHGVKNTAQIIFFDLQNIAVSNGSACNTGSIKSSHVLQAMGLDEQIIDQTIRVSLGFSNTAKEVHFFLQQWHQMASNQS